MKLVVDANYLLHRMAHQPSLSKLEKDGIPTGALFGALRSLRSTLSEFPLVTSVFLVFDGGTSLRRRAILPEYRVREHKDDGYRDRFNIQRDFLKELAPRIRCRSIQLPGKEADDVMAQIVQYVTETHVIMTDDKDLLQLVNDRVQVWRAMAGDLVTTKSFKEKVGIPMENFLLWKAVIGDTSDKIPGVRDVGEVTAKSVLGSPVGSLEELLQVCSGKKGKRYQAIAEGSRAIRRNLDLVDLYKEPFEVEEYLEVSRQSEVPLQELNGENLSTVLELLSFLGITSWIEDMGWIQKFEVLV